MWAIRAEDGRDEKVYDGPALNFTYLVRRMAHAPHFDCFPGGLIELHVLIRVQGNTPQRNSRGSNRRLTDPRP